MSSGKWRPFCIGLNVSSTCLQPPIITLSSIVAMKWTVSCKVEEIKTIREVLLHIFIKNILEFQHISDAEDFRRFSYRFNDGCVWYSLYLLLLMMVIMALFCNCTDNPRPKDHGLGGGVECYNTMSFCLTFNDKRFATSQSLTLINFSLIKRLCSCGSAGREYDIALNDVVSSIYRTSNGYWCMGIKGEMSGTVCVTFTWDMYIYIYIYMSCL